MTPLKCFATVGCILYVANATDYIHKFEEAMKEAKTYGAEKALEWGLHPGYTKYEPGFAPVRVFGSADRDGTNVSCFRIPSIVQTKNGTLLAFAEARGRFNHPDYNGTCADNSPLGIALKRSFDGGVTWPGPFTWAVHPDFVVGEAKRNCGGNPVAVYDTARDRVLLHFVRGAKNAGHDCIPGHSNWQVISTDDGASWSQPIDISKFLGNYVGALPGPGNGGLQVRSSGRLVFNAHFGTAERGYGAVIVYYSDDGGETYSLAETQPFPHMDESTMAETSDGSLVINMRNDPSTSGCPGGADNENCHVRAISRSVDGGVSWSPISFDQTLPDSICEASISLVANVTVFFNPAMRAARSMPTLRFSHDGGHTWKSQLVADSFADYSSIVNGELIHGPGSGGAVLGGVLFGGCTVPLPYRVWCMPDDLKDDEPWWTVNFVRFAMPNSTRTEAEQIFITV
eukprot:gnl/MRDRNA2_/MRDRNA2_62182_c0_seq1.p1 gnl/MRDRNA2_/MRDRNA2_62182_c0~~gnl/MRDRNA2_/MRDRNA2_62182_c0_seq1.p1  ORF type:complete len:490 (+),score=59.00 gnl/MRDRNA2_/MRDRNA2_62182_c0_seq1:103-1470(+)